MGLHFSIWLGENTLVSRYLKMETFTVKKLSRCSVLLFNNRLAVEPQEAFYLIILTNFVAF